MKIHSISLTNLASLYGNHKIDFDELLTDHRTFAITGATGSGKSTILKSILLALYGKTTQSTLNSADFVSKGRGEASIEIDFSCLQGRFTAHWNLKTLKKDGEALKNSTPVRWVTDANGKAIEKTPEEIIGLSFDQFTKTVILAQGEFARFLLAPFSERRKILEQLADAEHLALIGKKVRSDLKTIQIKSQGLQSTLDHFQDISDEQLAILTKKRTQLLSERNQSVREQKRIIDLLNYKNQFDQIERQKSIILLQLEESQKEQIAKTKSLNEFKNQLELERKSHLEFTNFALKRREVLFEARANFDLRNKQLAEQLEISEKKVLLSNEVQKKVDQRERLNRELTQVERSLSNQANIERPTLKWAESKGLEIVKNLQEINLLNAREKHLKESLQKSSKLLTQAKSERLKINQRFESANHDLEIPKVHEQIDEYEKKINDRQELIQYFHRYLSQQRFFESQSEELEQELSGFINQLSSAPDQRFREGMEVAIESGRCPVCSNTEIDIDELKRHLQLDSHLVDSNTLKQKIDERKERREKIRRTQQEDLHRFQEFAENSGLDPNGLNLKQLNLELESWKKELKDLRQNQTNGLVMEQEKKNLENRILEYESEQGQLNQDINSCLEKKEILLSQARDVHRELYEKIAELKNSPMEKIQSALKILEDSIHQKEIFQQKTFALESHDQQLNILKNQLKVLVEREGLINSQLNILNKFFIDHAVSDPETELKDLAQKQRTIESNLQQTNQRFHQIHNELSKIAGELEIRSNQIIELENQFFTLSENCMHNHFKDINFKSKAELIQKLNDLDLPELCESHQQSLSELEERLISTETEINHMATQLKRLKIQRDELNRLKIEENRYLKLDFILGKEEFRNFVLGIFEANVVALTNAELDRLCEGRYQIELRSHSKGNDFYVIDRWRDGDFRKISTLSGGETFLVALAMALGLAEMARGKTEIESFFIDEGFGTLDEDSLLEILEVLFSLEARGHTLGIISHIKSLTDRIPVNLVVYKNQLGHGQINTRYN